MTDERNNIFPFGKGPNQQNHHANTNAAPDRAIDKQCAKRNNNYKTKYISTDACKYILELISHAYDLPLD